MLSFKWPGFALSDLYEWSAATLTWFERQRCESLVEITIWQVHSQDDICDLLIRVALRMKAHCRKDRVRSCQLIILKSTYQANGAQFAYDCSIATILPRRVHRPNAQTTQTQVRTSLARDSWLLTKMSQNIVTRDPA
jgi:hypothetical protein